MTTRLQAIIDFAYSGGGIQQATSDLSKFQGKGKETEESFGKLGASFKNAAVAGVAFAGVVGGALAAGLAKTVMAASDAEESLSKFNVVFDKLEGGPEGLAQEVDALAEATGRSKYELIGAVGALGDLFQPLGFSTEAAADLSLQMTQLAIDLSSFNNMPMDEALQRLQGTLVGSHENALAFGVVINENTLKAQMMADGTDKLTGAQFEQAKVQARLNLLMAGTTAAQGDAIRTSDGFANQMKALQGEMADLSVEIGQKFLPAALEAIGAIREMATDAIPALVAAAETAGPALLDLVKGGIEQVSLAASTANLNTLYGQLKDLGLSAGDLSDILGDSRAQFDLWRTDADMADDLARNAEGVRKLQYALQGAEMGLENQGTIITANGYAYRVTTNDLNEFVDSMMAMNLGLPVAATGMEYWTLATRKVADAIIEADEAVTVATVDTSLLAIDVIHATNVIEEMKPAVEGVTGAIYASSEAIAAYTAKTGDYATQAIRAQEQGLDLNQVMYDSLDAAGGSAEALVGLALATGQLTEAQAENILKQAAMIEYAQGLGEQLAAGTISISDAVTSLSNFEASLETSNVLINTATGSVGLFDQSMVGAGGSADVLAGKLDGATVYSQKFIDTLNAIPKNIDVQVNVHGGEGITTHGGYQTPGDTGDPSQSGGTGYGGGGNVGDGFASGADFIVPPGYPNDSYPLRVQSGEHVKVTPAGQSSGGDTYNLYVTAMDGGANVAREFNYLKSLAGA